MKCWFVRPFRMVFCLRLGTSSEECSTTMLSKDVALLETLAIFQKNVQTQPVGSEIPTWKMGCCRSRPKTVKPRLVRPGMIHLDCVQIKVLILTLNGGRRATNQILGRPDGWKIIDLSRWQTNRWETNNRILLSLQLACLCFWPFMGFLSWHGVLKKDAQSHLVSCFPKCRSSKAPFDVAR